MMALVQLANFLYSFMDYCLESSLPQPSQDVSFLLSAFTSLGLPIFAFSVALLLLLLTNAEKGKAAWSRMVFFAGALALLAGGVVNLVVTWEFYHLDINDPFENYEPLLNLTYAGGLATTLGTVLIFIASILLVRSYLKGEISRDPRRALI
jgi:hypothetical protein